MLSAILAMSKNRVIGNKGQVPWHISEDYIYFNKTTKGHPIIMGRKTHESVSGFENHVGWAGQQSVIGNQLSDEMLEKKHKLLPDRTNIIVTRQEGYEVPGAIVVDSVEKAIEAAKSCAGSDEIFIVGGAEIYKAAMNYIDKFYITLIDEEVQGDAFFPELPAEFKLVQDKKRRVRVNDKEIKYSFQIYSKQPTADSLQLTAS